MKHPWVPPGCSLLWYHQRVIVYHHRSWYVRFHELLKLFARASRLANDKLSNLARVWPMTSGIDLESASRGIQSLRSLTARNNRTEKLPGMIFPTDYGHPMKAQIKDIWKMGPMWQTKPASAVLKNLGLGLNFRPCGERYFLSGRPQFVIFPIFNWFII